MKNFLTTFPEWDQIKKEMNGREFPLYREANSHIHTPFSFSSFSDMYSIFRMAREESIAVLGINDFFVTEGYDDFHSGCVANKIFPLFNIEFIGLMKEEQKKGIRINDPNNPGRIYFCGKGLDFPFEPGWFQKRRIKKVIAESQNQIKEMISKLNSLDTNGSPSLNLSYDSIKKELARELVRERHLAKAIRIKAEKNFSEPAQQLTYIESLYGGRKSKFDFGNPSALENEIRSNLLKNGGPAFVEEDDRSFMDLKEIIKIISDAGGIPCYPVLLDDASGKYTEFESDSERLFSSLSKLGISCIELIPGRNDINKLKHFVDYFNSKGFIITFGTEHNTPVMEPLSVAARGRTELDEELKKIAWEGACVLAAHQYLRAAGRQGYVLPDGSHSMQQRDTLAMVGRVVIEYFFNTK